MGYINKKRINNNNSKSQQKLKQQQKIHHYIITTNKNNFLNIINSRIKSLFDIVLKISFGYYFYTIFGGNVASAASAASSSSNKNLAVENNSGCPSSEDPNCLKCNADGCVKCPILLIIDTRECTDICPSGYLERWSSNPDEFIGKLCIPENSNTAIHAALTGVLAGFLLCLGFLIVSVIIIKRKRRQKTIKEILIAENRIDRCDFLEQLNELRPNSEYILAMLNDTRRQIRKLHLSGEVQAANSYRPLVRDLAKLLILLNRPIELIPAPPHDWNRIYLWVEKALEQYKPHVDHLIDYYQCDLSAPGTPTLTAVSSNHNEGRINNMRNGGVDSNDFCDGSLRLIDKKQYNHYNYQHNHQPQQQAQQQQIHQNYIYNQNSTAFRSSSSSAATTAERQSSEITSCIARDVLQSPILSTSSSTETNLIKNSHQMQIFGSLISLHEFDEPKLLDPFENNSFTNTLKSIRNCHYNSNNNSNQRQYNNENNYNHDHKQLHLKHHQNTNGDINATTTASEDNYYGTDNSNLMLTNPELYASSLWLEDEFFKLGLRPQDEITTEL